MKKENIYLNAKRALNTFRFIKGEYDCISCESVYNRSLTYTKTLYNVVEIVKGPMSIYVSFDVDNTINIWTPLMTSSGICKYYVYHCCIRTKGKVVAEWVAELCLAVAMVERDILKGVI